MNEAMAEDVHAQVEAFVQQVRATFDATRYPHLSDGAAFESTVAALDAEFTTLQRMFHDYLLASWSEEAAATLRSAAGAASSQHSGGNSRRGHR